MKGVIIAGGNGTRLKPLTLVLNKQLLPIYDKPMIFYPLKTLTDMGIKDIMIVSSPQHTGLFMQLLGDGEEYGANLTYKIQTVAGGIAQAVGLAEDFAREQFAIILGDNIYEYAPEAPRDCGLVLKEVENPQRFGVYHNGLIEEKPAIPKSNLAVTGLYFYTPEVFDFIKTLKPSARGEIEITDLNNWCLKNLSTEIIKYNGFWADAGTYDSLLSVGNFIQKIQKKNE